MRTWHARVHFHQCICLVVFVNEWWRVRLHGCPFGFRAGAEEAKFSSMGEKGKQSLYPSLHSLGPCTRRHQALLSLSRKEVRRSLDYWSLQGPLSGPEFRTCSSGKHQVCGLARVSILFSRFGVPAYWEISQQHHEKQTEERSNCDRHCQHNIPPPWATHQVSTSAHHSECPDPTLAAGRDTKEAAGPCPQLSHLLPLHSKPRGLRQALPSLISRSWDKRQGSPVGTAFNTWLQKGWGGTRSASTSRRWKAVRKR